MKCRVYLLIKYLKITDQGTNTTEDMTANQTSGDSQNVEINEDPEEIADLSDYPWTTISDVSECSPTFVELLDLMNSIYDDIDNDLRIVREKLIQDQLVKISTSCR